MASGAGQQTVDIGQLSLEQLNQLKQGLEEELQVLTNSFQQLKVAAQKYQESKNCLKTLNAANEGKTVMIPLTGSLYVRAELSNIDKVLVDLGTGYYAEKTVADGEAFTDRKVKIINDNVEKVTQAIVQKRKNMEAVLYVMQVKIDQAEQSQKGTAK
eukprot:TRINITY_DN17150_c0_g1_i1.p1 TRINITY_DN17150_c0_g1~~TRINITY_DN17150_c0_g1_i1.p1  ORF type:complete len:157 (+),score=41.16 TRINITY_DN17150_c0_g1_i1:611-1081(+)